MRVRYLSPLFVSVALVTTTDISGQTPERVVTTHEAVFWRVAKVRVMPRYPAGSLARGTEGVVVTSVTSTKEGHVERVDILESPDADMAAAVRAALAQWTIPAPQPMGSSTPYVARVNMTFYFQIRNGRGMVLAADQMPGNEDVFAAWNRPPAGRGTPAGPPPVVFQHGIPTREVDEAEFTRLVTGPNTVILDVRDRDQFAGGAHPRARNMPFGEVGTRSRAELSVRATVVIDCSRTETSRCRYAHDQLHDRGFNDVAIYLP